MEQTATPYPMDTSVLKKGDVIPVSVLRDIAKAEPGTSRYAFNLLRIKSFIAKAMARRGEYVTIAIVKNELSILTDSEANTYNMHFAKLGARKIRRGQSRHARIDLSKLTPDQRAEWDRNALRLGMMADGVSRSIKKLCPPPEPHKRLG